MSLTRSIAHNTAIQLIGKAISTLLGLIAIAILTRSLGVEKFGWYITVTGFLQFFGVLGDFGYTVVTANMLSEPAHDKTKLLNTLFSWRFLTAALLQIAAPFIILFLPYPAPLKIATFVISISFFTISLNQVFLGFYQTQLKLIIQMTGEILGRATLVMGLLLLTFGHADFVPMMTVVSIASVVYTSYLWLRAPKIKFQFDPEISRAIYKKTWPLAVTILFNAIYLQGDRLLLPLYASQTLVGLYGAAYRVLDLVAQSAFLVMGIMVPLISYAWSRQIKELFQKHFQTSFDLIMLIILPMVCGIIALATPIMVFIAGVKFAASGAILRVLSIAIFGICFGMIFGNIATAIGRQKQAMWLSAINAALSLVAYLIFIPKYGIWGAAGVTIFSEFFAGISLYYLTTYYAAFKPRKNNFLKILFASAIMGLLVFYLQPLNILISISIGIIIYVLLILILQVISKKTFQEILSK